MVRGIRLAMIMIACSGWLGAGAASAGSWCHQSAGCGADCGDACGDGCAEGCGESCCGLFGCPELSLFGSSGCSGLIQHSEPCFNDFISPMINFVFFEDPRTVTELRPIFVHHNVPNVIGAGVPAGGSVQLYAMQFRVALTDRLSLIAVKDGYIVDDTGGALNGLLGDGWSSVTAGLKYNLVRDPQNGTLVSAGFTYEVPIGSQRALQDVGDGELHLFLTGGQRLADGDAHVLSSFGYRQPIDQDVQNTAIHWSNHFDVRVTEQAYLFTEVAWWHWTDDAGAGLPGIAGQDLFNLTSMNVDGRDLVTQSVGVKLKPDNNTEIGIAYEFPLSGFEDIIEDRFMVDLIFRY